MEDLKNGPAGDVTKINVNLSLSALKPYYAIVITDLYQYLSSEKQKTIIKEG